MFKLARRNEHACGELEEFPLDATEGEYCFPRRQDDALCWRVFRRAGVAHLDLSYYIGLDWLVPQRLALLVEPKLDLHSPGKTAYLRMLASAFSHPESLAHLHDLVEIKFDAPWIEVAPEHDLLTPLLAVQFLSVMERLVRKGLKRSYYRVQRNLTGRVRGKILVGPALRQSGWGVRPLAQNCAYEEFGWDSLENRLLKKALRFVRGWLPDFRQLEVARGLERTLAYVEPAFAPVSDLVSMPEMKEPARHLFYPEYDEAGRLAHLILRRFGYALAHGSAPKRIRVPPFWIDMTKLFELYVLGLLTRTYGTGVRYQVEGHGQTPDYLLVTGGERVIIDAKYKRRYATGYHLEDIRQVSGYARDRKILEELQIPVSEWKNQVPKCLIIYPGGLAREPRALAPDSEKALPYFENMFALPVDLPMM